MSATRPLECREKKGGRSLLCEAPARPFRQLAPDPFFHAKTAMSDFL